LRRIQEQGGTAMADHGYARYPLYQQPQERDDHGQEGETASSFGEAELARASSSPAEQLDIGNDTFAPLDDNYNDNDNEIALSTSELFQDDHDDAMEVINDFDGSDTLSTDLNEKALARIRNGEWLDDFRIAQLLDRLVSIQSLDAATIDPLLIDRVPTNGSITHRLGDGTTRDFLLLVPVLCDAHWILLVLRAGDKSVTYFNSMPSLSMDNLLPRVQEVESGLVRGLGYNLGDAVSAGPTWCPEQLNSDDCGVAVVVNALYILAKKPLSFTSASCDYATWRHVLAALLDAELVDNLSLVPSDVTKEPTINLGVAEPRPESLRASEYREWMRNERQRLAAHMQSSIDTLLRFSSRCSSHINIINEVVAVLEGLTSPAGQVDTVGEELQSELESLTNALTCVRACIMVNDVG
jgi:hypothetical protein